jgi:hypothetical protein
MAESLSMPPTFRGNNDNNARLSPNTLPEDVVQMQLQAFKQSDIYSAFHLYASPACKEETGTWQQFEILLSSPPFDAIVGHHQADVLLTVSDGDQADCVCCLVRIVPGRGNKKKSSTTGLLYYWWELSKQQYDDDDDDDDDDENSANNGCYMIDSVIPDFEDTEVDARDFEDDDDDGGDDDDFLLGPGFIDITGF